LRYWVEAVLSEALTSCDAHQIAVADSEFVVPAGIEEGAADRTHTRVIGCAFGRNIDAMLLSIGYDAERLRQTA
jgi:hypothetical protein